MPSWADARATVSTKSVHSEQFNQLLRLQDRCKSSFDVACRLFSRVHSVDTVTIVGHVNSSVNCNPRPTISLAPHPLPSPPAPKKGSTRSPRQKRPGPRFALSTFAHSRQISPVLPINDSSSIPTPNQQYRMIKKQKNKLSMQLLWIEHYPKLVI